MINAALEMMIWLLKLRCISMRWKWISQLLFQWLLSMLLLFIFYILHSYFTLVWLCLWSLRFAIDSAIIPYSLFLAIFNGFNWCSILTLTPWSSKTRFPIASNRCPSCTSFTWWIFPSLNLHLNWFYLIYHLLSYLINMLIFLFTFFIVVLKLY